MKWLADWNDFMRDWKNRRVPNYSKVKRSSIDPDVVQVDYDTVFNSQYDSRVDPHKRLQLSPGEVGCILSHVKLWRVVERADEQSIYCIFEDDVTLTEDFSAAIERDVLPEVPADADMLYLSYVDMDPARDVKFSTHLLRPHVFFSTQGYCVTAKGAARLLQLLPVRGPLDVWLAQMFPSLRVFGATPPLARQHPSVVAGDSDIEHSALTDRFRS